eukprot:GEMP01001235.1.p1 GENE.GEMP01001235.1~~GEMP01001235.1.p1  ORF type:complete len:1361 (+),score=317.03 GEMP01001235.1:593-4675(+)
MFPTVARPWRLWAFVCAAVLLLYGCFGTGVELLLSSVIVLTNLVYVAYESSDGNDTNERKPAALLQWAFAKASRHTPVVLTDMSPGAAGKSPEKSLTEEASEAPIAVAIPTVATTTHECADNASVPCDQGGEPAYSSELSHNNLEETTTSSIEVFRPKRLGRPQPLLRWRSLVNKFTPEKFDTLLDQFLSALPEMSTQEENSTQIAQVLDLIFDAATKQHQYTSMYTDLCCKLQVHCAGIAPTVDFRNVILTKCQTFYHKTVMAPPAIPEDLSEEDETNLKVKQKNAMVGTAKFSGDLVTKALIPADCVMDWIHVLLSSSYSNQDSSVTPLSIADAEDDATLPSTSLVSPVDKILSNASHAPHVPNTQRQEKNNCERERQLEALCVILSTLGPSLNDSSRVWSEHNLTTIEGVFEELYHLGNNNKVGDASLSLRTRCLILDILDLREASWQEMRAHKMVKPTTLEARPSKMKDDDSMMNPNDKEMRDGVDTFVDFSIINNLNLFTHHVEMVDARDMKLHRLRTLIQLYHVINNMKLVLVAGDSAFPRLLQLFSQSFPDMQYAHITSNNTAAEARSAVADFERARIPEEDQTKKCDMLLLSNDVAAWEEIQCARVPLLINYDMGSRFYHFMSRLEKWTHRGSKVYTFFYPLYDRKRACQLVLLLEQTQQKVSPELQELSDSLPKRTSMHGGDPREGSQHMTHSWDEGSGKCGQISDERSCDAHLAPDGDTQQQPEQTKDSLGTRRRSTEDSTWRHDDNSTRREGSISLARYNNDSTLGSTHSENNNRYSRQQQQHDQKWECVDWQMEESTGADEHDGIDTQRDTDNPTTSNLTSPWYSDNAVCNDEMYTLHAKHGKYHQGSSRVPAIMPIEASSSYESLQGKSQQQQYGRQQQPAHHKPERQHDSQVQPRLQQPQKQHHPHQQYQRHKHSQEYRRGHQRQDRQCAGTSSQLQGLDDVEDWMWIRQAAFKTQMVNSTPERHAGFKVQVEDRVSSDVSRSTKEPFPGALQSNDCMKRSDGLQKYPTNSERGQNAGRKQFTESARHSSPFPPTNTQDATDIAGNNREYHTKYAAPWSLRTTTNGEQQSSFPCTVTPQHVEQRTTRASEQHQQQKEQHVQEYCEFTTHSTEKDSEQEKRQQEQHIQEYSDLTPQSTDTGTEKECEQEQHQQQHQPRTFVPTHAAHFESRGVQGSKYQQEMEQCHEWEYGHQSVEYTDPATWEQQQHHTAFPSNNRMQTTLDPMHQHWSNWQCHTAQAMWEMQKLGVLYEQGLAVGFHSTPNAEHHHASFPCTMDHALLGHPLFAEVQNLNAPMALNGILSSNGHLMPHNMLHGGIPPPPPPPPHPPTQSSSSSPHLPSNHASVLL